jgi:hypothetical protein
MRHDAWPQAKPVLRRALEMRPQIAARRLVELPLPLAATAPTA